MDLFFHRKACRFDSPLTMREMIAVLNERGPWRFVERDSDRWGVYTSSCAARPDVAVVKIIEEDGRFLIVASYESTAPGAAKEWVRLLRDVTERVLPAVGATNISRTFDYE